MNLLKINNLTVSADNNKIINNLNIVLKKGEIHAILGPNGNGKTTLFHSIMGSPNYKINKGTIQFLDKEIQNLEVDERSKMGIFLTFQNPVEIDGVVNLDFLRMFINSKNQTDIFSFYKKIEDKSKGIKLPHNYLERYLNHGFSGGEKKSYELLQLKLSKCKLALIDEIDSGLDSDSLKSVVKTINILRKEDKDFGALIISHYDKMFDHIKIDKFHILINGSIITSGGKELLEKIHKSGYGWVYEEFNISDSKENQSILDSCGINK